MQEITLHQTLPLIFRDEPIQPSEVWRTEVTFCRGNYYLIEATSGAGKSSLCSFLYGWRGDYLGNICFDGQDIRKLSAGAWSAIRRSSLSFLFQEMRLFDELTAWENVKLKNDLTKYKKEKELRHSCFWTSPSVISMRRMHPYLPRSIRRRLSSKVLVSSRPQ